MPRIILKPNSAEYADHQKKEHVLYCEMPGCNENAEHKAPKHRGLNEHHSFCLEHVRDYNKAWDFFSGMSATEVNSHMNSARYGHRPTWQYTAKGAAEDILRNKAWQTYNDTEADPKQHSHENGHNENSGMSPNSPEFEALAIMGLEPPVDLTAIKTQYKKLAKKHHPDLNQGCTKSEELLKHINMAYTILKLAYQQFEQLPKREK